MMADGFVIVQCGKMNEVKPIALDLSNYAKAIGAGERVNRHAASLLKMRRTAIWAVSRTTWPRSSPTWSRSLPPCVIPTWLT